MTLSNSVYWTLYTAGVGWASLLAINYRSLWNRKREKVGKEIRSFNAKKGYNQSIGRKELATALLNPFSSKILREFSNNNDIEYSRYRTELGENIDTARNLRLVALILLGGFILTLFGLSYLNPQIPISREIYIILLYATLATNTILYVYL